MKKRSALFAFVWCLSVLPLLGGGGSTFGIEVPAFLTDRDEEVVRHSAYTLSYNKKHRVANWVAWVLTSARTYGTIKRGDCFQADPYIRRGPRVGPTEYRGSGYDRGHMCPSADNKHTATAMEECFYMSNMCPQTHTLNGGDWKELEERCRKWARQYGTLYIVAGPVIRKGERYATIGESQVMVPKQFYKVVLRYTSPREAEAIGFVYNNNSDNRPMASYVCTIDDVERLTGINFFSKLPKDEERRAEATVHKSKWGL